MGSKLISSHPIYTEEVLHAIPRENPTPFLGVSRNFPLGDFLSLCGVERLLGLATTGSWLCISAAWDWSSTGFDNVTKSSGQRGTKGCILKCSNIRSEMSGFSDKIHLTAAAILPRAVACRLRLPFGVRTGSSSPPGLPSS